MGELQGNNKKGKGVTKRVNPTRGVNSWWRRREKYSILKGGGEPNFLMDSNDGGDIKLRQKNLGGPIVTERVDKKRERLLL